MKKATRYAGSFIRLITSVKDIQKISDLVLPAIRKGLKVLEKK